MTKILLLVSVFSLTVLSKVSVPSYKVTKLVKYSGLGYSKKLKLNFKIDLPEGQKINTGAPSKILIHEKIMTSDKVSFVKRIRVNEKVLLEGMDLSFSEDLSLSSESSHLIISAEIVHCSSDNKGACYIDNFQRKITRKPGRSLEAEIKFFPTKS